MRRKKTAPSTTNKYTNAHPTQSGKMSLRILNIMPETILDGEGIRYSIYLAGCRHNCPGCHNPESHNPLAGEVVTKEMIEQIIEEIQENPMLDGVTFSGGDPLFNPEEFLPLLRTIKQCTQMNIWCYTGFTYEAIKDHPRYQPLLEYIDVLVDGRFVASLYDPRLSFRGSSNQRIINLAEKRKP